MAHKHSVYDTDTHFKIDAVTRQIKNDSSGKTVLIQGDHNSERFTFEVPRLVDGHDLSLCDVVQVHYINIDSTNKNNVSKDLREVDDLQISPDSDDVVILSWLIDGKATRYAGTLHFAVKFKCTDGAVKVYEWNTMTYTGISVSSGIDNGEAIVEDYSDVLEQWRAELFSGTGGNVDLSGYVKTVNGVAPDESGNVKITIPDSGQNADLSTLTLGIHTDGLVYIFLGGKPMGNGLNISGGSIVEPVYGDPVVDNAILSINKGQTVQLGVKLSEKPTQNQTITVLTDSNVLSCDKTVLTFTPDNWNVFQFVSVTAGEITEDATATITLRNSDALLTDTTITVYLTADAYSVDTTIPDGAHVCTIDDFADYHTADSKTDVALGAYIGEYTNIVVPAKMTVNGVEKTARITNAETFKGNTALQYVTIEDGVAFGSTRSANFTADNKMNSIFEGCTSLIGADYRGSIAVSLANACKGCTSLKFFKGVENQVNATILAACFQGCTALEYLPDLSGLVKLAGSNNAEGLAHFANGCSNLKKIYGFPKVLENSCTVYNVFYNCNALENAVIPANATNLGYSLAKCTSLRKCEIYNDDLTADNALNAYTFQNCEDLEVYCTDGSTTHETLLSAFGGSTDVEILTFGSESALPSIVVWGDSTTSPGTAWKCWPDRLQEKLGTEEYLVKNEAVSGEFTTSTSARQGGNALSVDAFTIPADTAAVSITMKSADGQIFGASPVFSAGGSFNPCVIAGVEGVVSAPGTSFTRRYAGEAVSVADGSAVLSSADNKLNNADNVMIVELGNNAGWNTDPNVLLNQMQVMVNHFTSQGGTKYILFGPFSGQYLRSADDIAKVKTFESLAVEAFGEHFISIRQYLIDNGLTDNGLSASTLDAERMTAGQIPASLLGGGSTGEIKMYDGATVTDDAHPNAYGANSIMLGIYAKGQALGYW